MKKRDGRRGWGGGEERGGKVVGERREGDRRDEGR